MVDLDAGRQLERGIECLIETPGPFALVDDLAEPPELTPEPTPNPG